MKKIISAVSLLLALLMLTTACANNGEGDQTTTDGAGTAAPGETTTAPDTTAEPAGDTITGEPLALLEQIVTDAKVELKAETLELPAETAEYLVGLTADDLKDVESAAISQGMIMSQAHMVALFKCKDAEAAQTIKQKLHDQFNIRRWVCVIPQQCYVIESGSYVFFAATYDDFATPLQEAFTALAGDNIGERLDIEGAEGEIEGGDTAGGVIAG